MKTHDEAMKAATEAFQERWSSNVYGASPLEAAIQTYLSERGQAAWAFGSDYLYVSADKTTWAHGPEGPVPVLIIPQPDRKEVVPGSDDDLKDMQAYIDEQHQLPHDEALSPSDPMVIIAGIKQFGLAPDGSDLQDLRSAIERLQVAAGFKEGTRNSRGTEQIAKNANCSDPVATQPASLQPLSDNEFEAKSPPQPAPFVATAPSAGEDIVGRLRYRAMPDQNGQYADRLCGEAADEIERLRAERLRGIDYSADLQRIIEALCYGNEIPEPKTGARHHYDMACKFRSTLSKTQG